jgi:hypothetical protein
MIKATFIIPKADNNGVLFPTGLVAKLQMQIIDMFGGYTLREATGAWQDEDGKIYNDNNWVFEVSMKKDQVATLVNWLEQAKVVLGQEAMYLEITEANIQFI